MGFYANFMASVVDYLCLSGISSMFVFFHTMMFFFVFDIRIRQRKAWSLKKT